MKLPSRKQCFEILKQYHTPKHIIKHSLAVNKIAVFLAQEFNKKGQKINVDLVDRSSLLHDVLRICDIKGSIYAFTEPSDLTKENIKKWESQRKKYQGQHHAQITANIFVKKYPQMAEVIRRHRMSTILTIGFNNWEEKLVFYADKRINHDKPVSIIQRFRTGEKRWKIKKEENRLPEILKKIKKMEEEIFSIIRKKPNVVNKL